jgi:hypothetical protein
MRTELFSAFLLFLMGDFLDFSLQNSTLFHLFGEIIPAQLYWRTEALLRKWRCGSNSERKL